MSELQRNTRKPARITSVALCKKESTNQYDPQIGQAAQANSNLAQQAQDFSEKYFTDQVSPALKAMTDSSTRQQANLDQIYGLNISAAKQAQDRYNQYGVPAEQKYYDMVSQYNEPAEVERQTSLALGDARASEAGQRATYGRQLSSLGINPASPEATATLGQMGVANSAMEAGAMNRARMAAKQLGMSLTSDAANFGRGGQSSVLAFSQGAGNAAQGGFGIASGNLAGVNSGAGVPMAGYGLAQRGYTANLDAYTQLGQSDMQQQGQADAGLGQFLGTALGVGASMFKFSDRRLKHNLTVVGELANGIKVYEFSYNWGGLRQVGVLADEVEVVLPEAVATHETGYKMVDYGALPCALV